MELHNDTLTAIPGDKPVSRHEEKRLTELERTLLKRGHDYIEVGSALREIRDKCLYRRTSPSFERYCKDRLDIARQRAYQLIDAAIVAVNVSNTAPSGPKCKRENVNHGRQIPILPQNERQARELGRVPSEKQSEVWQTVIASAPNGRITAVHIARTIRNLKVEAVERAIEKVSGELRGPYNMKRMCPEFHAAFRGFLEQVRRARKTDWRDTDPEVVANHLKAVLAAVLYEV